MKNKDSLKYYIGVDIGTNSVGWAVIDENGCLLNKGKHHLWGSRLFDQAQTAQARRGFRSTLRSGSIIFYSFRENDSFR